MLNQPIAADFTVPAGTTRAAPAVLAMAVTGNWIDRVRLTIPSGHNGLTGFQLMLAGTVVVPYSGAGWIIGSDHVYEFDVKRWANPGQLVCQGYNGGIYNHTFHVVADAYPTEPVPPVSAVTVAGSPSAVSTDLAVAALTGTPDDTTGAAAADQSSGAPEIDTSDLDELGDLPSADVDTFAPPPDVTVAPLTIPAHPVDRSRLGGHQAAASAPPARKLVKVTVKGRAEVAPPRTEPRKPAKPPERKPAGHAPKGRR